MSHCTECSSGETTTGTKFASLALSEKGKASSLMRATGASPYLSVLTMMLRANSSHTSSKCDWNSDVNSTFCPLRIKVMPPDRTPASRILVQARMVLFES